MGIAEMRFSFLQERVRRHFFRHTDFLRFKISKKIFFLNSDFRYYRKMYRLFPCIPIFRQFFSQLEVYKECVYVIMLKIALLLANFVFFGLKKGISQLLHWVAQKNTAYFVFLFLVLFFINRKLYTFKIKLFCNFFYQYFFFLPDFCFQDLII